jgi:hypothetical protein
MAVDMGGYNTVAERMREFFDKHPEATLKPASPWRIERIGDQTFIVFEAAAYRTPDDPNPGIGTAWEAFPGRTSYTRDSELMNAETSAWGRAILAVGAADVRKGVATAEDVRNRQADEEARRAPRDGRQEERREPENPKPPKVWTDDEVREQHAKLTQLDLGKAAKLYDWMAGKDLHSRAIDGGSDGPVSATEVLAVRLADTALLPDTAVDDLVELRDFADGRGLLKVQVSKTETLDQVLVEAREVRKAVQTDTPHAEELRQDAANSWDAQGVDSASGT